AFFEAAVIETRQVFENEGDVRVFYAAETGLNRAALDMANDGTAVLSTVSPNPTFDSFKTDPSFSTTTPTALYASKCFGTTSCDSANNPRSPAYVVEALNHADTDKFWLVSTACVPGPATGSATNACAAASTAMAQVKALIKKTVTTTTTTTTTTIPEFTWG